MVSAVDGPVLPRARLRELHGEAARLELVDDGGSLVGLLTLDNITDLLLVRRADNGKWTLPAGILEPGEEPAVAAPRALPRRAAATVKPWLRRSGSSEPQVTLTTSWRVMGQH